jgi:small subunit ribosomal protein S3
MGQKIHPIGFRLSVSRNWASRWYANSRLFPKMLNEDLRVREYLRRKLKNASVGRVLIERPAKNARITIYSARPGVSSSARRARTSSCSSRISPS